MNNKQEKITFYPLFSSTTNRTETKPTKNPVDDIKNSKFLEQMKFLRHQKVSLKKNYLRSFL